MNFAALLTVVLLLSFSAYAQDSSAITHSDGITYSSTDQSGITIETRIVIEKDGDRAKITFWQETDNGFVFKNVNWHGDVELELDNGGVIHLKDTDLKGHSFEEGGYSSGYYIPDHYQRYSAYYLSAPECALLKKHALTEVRYSLDDKFEAGVHQMTISDPRRILKE